MAKKSVFITVGTTDFDALISSIDNEEFITFLSSHGFAEIVLQIGRGK